MGERVKQELVESLEDTVFATVTVHEGGEHWLDSTEWDGICDMTGGRHQWVYQDCYLVYSKVYRCEACECLIAH